MVLSVSFGYEDALRGDTQENNRDFFSPLKDATIRQQSTLPKKGLGSLKVEEDNIYRAAYQSLKHNKRDCMFAEALTNLWGYISLKTMNRRTTKGCENVMRHNVTAVVAVRIKMRVSVENISCVPHPEVPIRGYTSVWLRIFQYFTCKPSGADRE